MLVVLANFIASTPFGYVVLLFFYEILNFFEQNPCLISRSEDIDTVTAYVSRTDFIL
jgi:hypothetical protein